MSEDSQVSRSTRDWVVRLLWVPPILLLVGGSAAVAIAMVRFATEGSLGALSTPVDPTLVFVGVTGALALLYLTVLRETFGGDTVEAAQDDLEDLSDSTTEATDNE